MADRTYRLWGYSPSHARLVLRAVADDEEPRNIDHIFVGVRQLNLPNTIDGLEVTEARPSDVAEAASQGVTAARGATLWVLSSSGHPQRSRVGWIVAAEHAVEENDLPLFETRLDQETPQARDAFDFERRVLLALAPFGVYEPGPSNDRGFDFWFEGTDGRHVAVEAKWFRGRPTTRSVRSLVMQIGSFMRDDIDDVVVAFGGVDKADQPQFAKTLRDDLVTVVSGYGARPHVVAADDTLELQRVIEPLVHALG